MSEQLLTDAELKVLRMRFGPDRPVSWSEADREVAPTIRALLATLDEARAEMLRAHDEGLLDQTQTKLEEMTRDKHRLEQENIGLHRDIKRLNREATRLGHSQADGAVKKALDLIDRCGGIDGAHHKQWVLDQLVRILTGDDYSQWVQSRRDNDYDWSEGIPP